MPPLPLPAQWARGSSSDHTPPLLLCAAALWAGQGPALAIAGVMGGWGRGDIPIALLVACELGQEVRHFVAIAVGKNQSSVCKKTFAIVPPEKCPWRRPGAGTIPPWDTLKPKMMFRSRERASPPELRGGGGLGVGGRKLCSGTYPYLDASLSDDAHPADALRLRRRFPEFALTSGLAADAPPFPALELERTRMRSPSTSSAERESLVDMSHPSEVRSPPIPLSDGAVATAMMRRFLRARAFRRVPFVRSLPKARRLTCKKMHNMRLG